MSPSDGTYGPSVRAVCRTPRLLVRERKHADHGIASELTAFASTDLLCQRRAGVRASRLCHGDKTPQDLEAPRKIISRCDSLQ